MNDWVGTFTLHPLGEKCKVTYNHIYLYKQQIIKSLLWWFMLTYKNILITCINVILHRFPFVINLIYLLATIQCVFLKAFGLHPCNFPNHILSTYSWHGCEPVSYIREHRGFSFGMSVTQDTHSHIMGNLENIRGNRSIHKYEWYVILQTTYCIIHRSRARNLIKQRSLESKAAVFLFPVYSKIILFWCVKQYFISAI